MSDIIWLGIGFSGQFFFSARFLLQWFCSEKEGKSIIPPAFWHFSILGCLVLFIYALHNHDAVISSGQLFALIIYGRNLYLIYRERREKNYTYQQAQEI